MKRIDNTILLNPVWALGLAACLFTACNEKESTGPEAETDGVKIKTETPYTAMFTTGGWPNVGYFIVPIPSLTEGVVSLAGNGAEMSAELYAQDVPQRNGYYYHANFGAGKLGKYHVEKGVLHTDKKVPFTEHGVSTYIWKDDETLVLLGTGETDTDVKYSIVNIRDLTVEKSGKFDLTAIVDTIFNRYWVGAANLRDGKIFLSYSLGANWNLWPDMPIYGKGHIAVIDYATMRVEKIIESKDLKGSTGPMVYAQASFEDENGDIYFLTDPGYESDTTSPSRIHRIRKGSTDVDAAYDFDLSASINGGMGAAIWYIGGGKAIVRARDSVTNIDAQHFFSVVNVHTGAYIKKLDLPADVAERMIEAVIIESGKAYIVVTSTGKDYIWEYDPAADKLTRGVELVGADIVKRLEKVR